MNVEASVPATPVRLQQFPTSIFSPRVVPARPLRTTPDDDSALLLQAAAPVPSSRPDVLVPSPPLLRAVPSSSSSVSLRRTGSSSPNRSAQYVRPVRRLRRLQAGPRPVLLEEVLLGHRSLLSITPGYRRRSSLALEVEAAGRRRSSTGRLRGNRFEEAVPRIPMRPELVFNPDELAAVENATRAAIEALHDAIVRRLHDELAAAVVGPPEVEAQRLVSWMEVCGRVSLYNREAKRRRGVLTQRFDHGQRCVQLRHASTAVAAEEDHRRNSIEAEWDKFVQLSAFSTAAVRDHWQSLLRPSAALLGHMALHHRLITAAFAETAAREALLRDRTRPEWYSDAYLGAYELFQEQHREECRRFVSLAVRRFSCQGDETLCRRRIVDDALRQSFELYSECIESPLAKEAAIRRRYLSLGGAASSLLSWADYRQRVEISDDYEPAARWGLQSECDAEQRHLFEAMEASARRAAVELVEEDHRGIHLSHWTSVSVTNLDATGEPEARAAVAAKEQSSWDKCAADFRLSCLDLVNEPLRRTDLERHALDGPVQLSSGEEPANAMCFDHMAQAVVAMHLGAEELRERALGVAEERVEHEVLQTAFRRGRMHLIADEDDAREPLAARALRHLLELETEDRRLYYQMELRRRALLRPAWSTVGKMLNSMWLMHQAHAHECEMLELESQAGARRAHLATRERQERSEKLLRIANDPLGAGVATAVVRGLSTHGLAQAWLDL